MSRIRQLACDPAAAPCVFRFLLTGSAERTDLQGDSQNFELSDLFNPAPVMVELRHLDVLNLSATHADNMVMRRRVAVIPCTVVERRHLAHLAGRSKSLQGAMNRCQGNVRMLATNAFEHSLGTRMVLCVRDNPQNGQTLRRHRPSQMTQTFHGHRSPLGLPRRPFRLRKKPCSNHLFANYYHLRTVCQLSRHGLSDIASRV